MKFEQLEGKNSRYRRVDLSPGADGTGAFAIDRGGETVFTRRISLHGVLASLAEGMDEGNVADALKFEARYMTEVAGQKGTFRLRECGGTAEITGPDGIVESIGFDTFTEMAPVPYAEVKT